MCVTWYLCKSIDPCSPLGVISSRVISHTHFSFSYITQAPWALWPWYIWLYEYMTILVWPCTMSAPELHSRHWKTSSFLCSSLVLSCTKYGMALDETTLYKITNYNISGPYVLRFSKRSNHRVVLNRISSTRFKTPFTTEPYPRFKKYSMYNLLLHYLTLISCFLYFASS